MMQSTPLDSPTTLVIPQTAADLVGNVPGGAPLWMFVVGTLLIIIAALAFSTSRTRRMDPRELAFRKITHKMGYSRNDIKLIRKTALKSGLTSPVGVVMSPTMCDKILKRQPAS
jgi:hypothetical protein